MGAMDIWLAMGLVDYFGMGQVVSVSRVIETIGANANSFFAR
jgi:hypothetical protein